MDHYMKQCKGISDQKSSPGASKERLPRFIEPVDETSFYCRK